MLRVIFFIGAVVCFWVAGLFFRAGLNNYRLLLGFYLAVLSILGGGVFLVLAFGG